MHTDERDRHSAIHAIVPACSYMAAVLLLAAAFAVHQLYAPYIPAFKGVLVALSIWYLAIFLSSMDRIVLCHDSSMLDRATASGIALLGTVCVLAAMAYVG